MKFLCLAYGKEEDWLAMTEQQRDDALRQDEVLRRRGAFIAAVGQATVVRAWEGQPERSSEPHAAADPPLVGFSTFEAGSMDEAVALVAGTPCAVAGGAIEVRPIVEP